MNFKTYLEILEAEGLEESPLADGVLMQAMDAQKQIIIYGKHEANQAVNKEVRRLEEHKLKMIWLAIDMAREYPPGSDMHQMMLREFRKSNKREFKGFLNEYKLMQIKGESIEGEVSLSNLTPVEQRVNDRWNKAMERMKG